MTEPSNEVLQKWSALIDYAKAYWIDSQPTGISDIEFDKLETRAAREDGFYVRDYVFSKFLKGTKTKNKYIEKIKKFKVGENDTMLNALCVSSAELNFSPDEVFCNLKYDGSSIAVYTDSNTGTPLRIVTVGNLNLDNFGVDQTWKLINLVPKSFPKGIKAIQCEALVDTTRLNDIDPDKARQKANGLINSKYLDSEVSSLLTLRAYRYYLDSETYEGQRLSKLPYREVLGMLQTVVSRADGHILFAPAQTWTLRELINLGGDYTETSRTTTNTGTFLNDGWVLYDRFGTCLRAVKYRGAGSGSEVIKTTVRGIQWNDQTEKGKDSWSANVIVDPVTVRGCVIKKPSAGSVSKLLKNNITPGAEVGIILANSTIPMVGEVLKPGNGNFQWPTCNCGYTLGPNDIYGSLIKCGNKNCTERIGRMRRSIEGLKKASELDLDTLLVIDRFKWKDTDIELRLLWNYVRTNDKGGYHDYLMSFMKTELQRRNMELVWEASWTVLREKVLGK